MTKLILNVEEDVVRKAKQIAKSNQTSVSAMFSQFIKSLGAQHTRQARIGPLTQKLSGLIKLPARRDHKL